jgi:hypothetical protein
MNVAPTPLGLAGSRFRGLCWVGNRYARFFKNYTLCHALTPFDHTQSHLWFPLWQMFAQGSRYVVVSPSNLLVAVPESVA